MRTWIKKWGYFIFGIGLAIMFMVLLGGLWVIIPQTLDLDIKILFILAFSVGSTGLIGLLICLYLLFRLTRV